MAGFRLLLADDDDDDVFILSQAFEEVDPCFDLTRVKDGTELLAYLDEVLARGIQLPDLLLLDLNMPRLNGLQALEQIRKNPRFKPMPVFMHSTSVNEEERQASIRLGANAFFVKAYSFKKVLSLVSLIDFYLTHRRHDSALDLKQGILQTKVNHDN